MREKKTPKTHTCMNIHDESPLKWFYSIRIFTYSISSVAFRFCARVHVHVCEICFWFSQMKPTVHGGDLRCGKH